jgi:hypothetical protein
MAQDYAYGNLARDEGQVKLSPEELNKKFPNLEVPFASPQYPEVAKIIADRQAVRRERQAWIDRGGPTGMLFNFSAGAAGGADPINLALGGVLGAASKAAGFARGLIPVFAENFTANLAGEIPNALQAGREQRTPPTASEVVIGAVEGAVVGTGIHMTVSKLFGKAENEVIQTSSEKTMKQNTKAAIDQHEAGAHVDMSPAAALEVAKQAGGMKPGFENTYRPGRIAGPNDVDFYFPVDPDTGRLVGKYTHGVYGVDNPNVARNFSGSGEAPGQSIRGRLPGDAKLALASKSFREFFAEPGMSKGDAVSHALERIKGIMGDDRKFRRYEPGLRAILESDSRASGSLKSAFDYFDSFHDTRILTENDVPIKDFMQLMDGIGYDGLHFETRIGDFSASTSDPLTGALERRGKPDNVNLKLIDQFDSIGKELGPLMDNRVFLNDPNLIEPIEALRPDKGLIPEMTIEEAKAFSDEVHAPENNRYYNEDVLAEVKPLESTSTETLHKEVSLEKADSPIAMEITQAEASIKEVIDQPGNDAVKAEYERIQAEFENENNYLKAIQLLGECVGKQMS